MTTEDTELAVSLTKIILEHTCRLDLSMALQYADKDISISAPRINHLICGKENAKNTLMDISGLLSPCRITNTEIHIVQNCGNACTIVHRSTMTSNTSQIQQNCIFVWELTRLGLRIKHLGINNPFLLRTQGSSDCRPSAVDMHKKIIFNDSDDFTRFVYTSSVLYATSDGRNIVMHCIGENIPAHMSLSDFVNAAGNRFFQIHRCHVLNVDYITLLKPYCAIMTDGSKLPIPAKKYSATRLQIISLITGAELIM